MSKRWTSEDLDRLKKRGFKVIETTKTGGAPRPELSEFSLDVPNPSWIDSQIHNREIERKERGRVAALVSNGGARKRGRPNISDPNEVAKLMNDWGIEVINGNVPSKSNSYVVAKTAGHGTLIKSDTLKKYEESFLWQCQKYRNKNISVPFEFYVKVYYTSKRPDLDNAMKILLDCLQIVKAIKNDNNCMKIVAEKFIDKERPRVEFKIMPV